MLFKYSFGVMGIRTILVEGIPSKWSSDRVLAIYLFIFRYFSQKLVHYKGWTPKPSLSSGFKNPDSFSQQ